MSEALVPEKQKQRLKEPPKFQVVILNDDFTPMDYVVRVLKNFLSVTGEAAERMTFEIHTKGKAGHGNYTREVAETRAMLIVNDAQENGHPLKAEIEEV